MLHALSVLLSLAACHQRPLGRRCSRVWVHHAFQHCAGPRRCESQDDEGCCNDADDGSGMNQQDVEEGEEEEAEGDDEGEEEEEEEDDDNIEVTQQPPGICSDQVPFRACELPVVVKRHTLLSAGTATCACGTHAACMPSSKPHPC